jgi:hypothetical protein
MIVEKIITNSAEEKVDDEDIAKVLTASRIRGLGRGVEKQIEANGETVEE